MAIQQKQQRRNPHYALTEDDVRAIVNEVIHVAELCLAEQSSTH